jgi:hypothetical protein
VSDEHNGRAAALPKPQQIVVERHPGDLVERGEGLVEQQQIGIGDQGAGDRDPHAHAARELARISPLKPGEPDRGDFHIGPVSLARPDPSRETKGQQHIVDDGAPRHQGRILKDKANPARWDMSAAIRCEREAADTRARLAEAGDDAQQRALPQPEGEQADELAGATERSTRPTPVNPRRTLGDAAQGGTIGPARFRQFGQLVAPTAFAA